MQLHTKPVQSHRPVPVELTKRDGQGSFYRAQCKILTLNSDFKALVVLDNERYNAICVSQFPLWMTDHTLKWEGVWRELGCLARSASFAVREESGHTLKSALSVRCVLMCYSLVLTPWI